MVVRCALSLPFPAGCLAKATALEFVLVSHKNWYRSCLRMSFISLQQRFPIEQGFELELSSFQTFVGFLQVIAASSHRLFLQGPIVYFAEAAGPTADAPQFMKKDPHEMLMITYLT